MDRRYDGFQGVRYRKVTSRVNEGGWRACSDLEIEEVRRWKLEKVVSELLLPKPGGMCYRHNLAGPEGGLRAR
jgi:hypothetical protein